MDPPPSAVARPRTNQQGLVQKNQSRSGVENSIQLVSSKGSRRSEEEKRSRLKKQLSRVQKIRSCRKEELRQSLSLVGEGSQPPKSKSTTKEESFKELDCCNGLKGDSPHLPPNRRVSRHVKEVPNTAKNNILSSQPNKQRGPNNEDGEMQMSSYPLEASDDFLKANHLECQLQGHAVQSHKASKTKSEVNQTGVVGNHFQSVQNNQDELDKTSSRLRLLQTDPGELPVQPVLSSDFCRRQNNHTIGEDMALQVQRYPNISKPREWSEQAALMRTGQTRVRPVSTVEEKGEGRKNGLKNEKASISTSYERQLQGQCITKEEQGEKKWERKQQGRKEKATFAHLYDKKFPLSSAQQRENDDYIQSYTEQHPLELMLKLIWLLEKDNTGQEFSSTSEETTSDSVSLRNKEQTRRILCLLKQLVSRKIDNNTETCNDNSLEVSASVGRRHLAKKLSPAPAEISKGNRKTKGSGEISGQVRARSVSMSDEEPIQPYHQGLSSLFSRRGQMSQGAQFIETTKQPRAVQTRGGGVHIGGLNRDLEVQVSNDDDEHSIHPIRPTNCPGFRPSRNVQSLDSSRQVFRNREPNSVQRGNSERPSHWENYPSPVLRDEQFFRLVMDSFMEEESTGGRSTVSMIFRNLSDDAGIAETMSMESSQIIEEMNSFRLLLNSAVNASLEMHTQMEREALTKEKIMLLPCRVISDTNDPLLSTTRQRRQKIGQAQCQCAICLEQYEVSDAVRTLPCFHSFHVKCVDLWLLEKAECPICKQFVSVTKTVSA